MWIMLSVDVNKLVNIIISLLCDFPVVSVKYEQTSETVLVGL